MVCQPLPPSHLHSDLVTVSHGQVLLYSWVTCTSRSFTPGGSSADTKREPGGDDTQCDTPPQETVKSLQTVVTTLSVNRKEQVVFSQMVPDIPVWKGGVILVGDSLVSVDELEIPTFKGNKPYKNHTTDLKPNDLLINFPGWTIFSENDVFRVNDSWKIGTKNS
jgi:hypothetical protein